MSCTHARRAMFDALDGGPEPRDHIDACDRCRAIFDGLRRVDELLRDQPLLDPPADLTARVLAAVRPPSWRREMWKVAAAIAVAIGLTAFTYSALWDQRDRISEAVRTPFDAVQGGSTP